MTHGGVLVRLLAMATGRLEGYRETLLMLGRAAGLTGLTLATLGSGPCGPCTTHNECATLDDLRDLQAAGLSSESPTAGTAGTAAADLAANLSTAKGWDATSCPTPEQYRAIVQLGYPQRYDDSSITVQHIAEGKCCYHVEGHDCGEGGRPFLVHGEARVANLLREGASAASTTAAVTHTWLADAQMEHASIAAFARLSLQLLSLGAPTELVRDAQLASLDELRHADFFFELASRHAGSPLRPGPLDVAGALDDCSLAGLVESNLLEGCIGETLAAEQLRQRAELVDDPELQAALLSIAEDETRHAALAFRILAWCRHSAPDLTRKVLQRVLASADPYHGDNDAWQHVVSPLLTALC